MTPSPRIAGGGDEAAGGTGGEAGSGDMDATIETPTPVRNTSLAETGPFGPGGPDPGIHDPETHEPGIHEPGIHEPGNHHPESMDRGAMNSDHL